MWHPSKKEIFTIPNILGYLRILAIPVFMYFYLSADCLADYYIAAIVAGASAVSDFFDGYIARHFHMVTQLGKFIDPLADKLSQGAMIVCLCTQYPVMLLMVMLFVVKEGFMAIMGWVMLQHNGRKLDGAMWYGKVCTAILYTCMFVFFLEPQLPAYVSNSMVLGCMLAMLATLLLYIPVFHTLYQQAPRKEEG